jgi:hypothetical protein
LPNRFLKFSFALAWASGETAAPPAPKEHPGTEQPRTPAKHASGTSVRRIPADRLTEHIRRSSSSQSRGKLKSISANLSVAGPAVEARTNFTSRSSGAHMAIAHGSVPRMRDDALDPKSVVQWPYPEFLCRQFTIVHPNRPSKKLVVYNGLLRLPAILRRLNRLFFIFILVMHESNGLRLYDEDEHITRTGGELMYGRSCRESCRTTDFIYFELNIRYR